LTDVRNSTPLAERLGPEDMLRLLNKVFEVQNRAVFAEEGSLETPVGDQFLAYWGAPDPQPDGSDRALRAALALIEGMQALRESLEPEIRELFGFGVALHTDHALIGNIGSAQYFHYGPVGDVSTSPPVLNRSQSTMGCSFSSRVRCSRSSPTSPSTACLIASL
jgi:class 3 adenylate cyclase